MDYSSIIGSFGGFLFDEAATSNEESTEIVEWKEVLKKLMGELKKEPQFLKKLDSVMRSGNGSLPYMGCLLGNSTVKKVIGEYAAKCKQNIDAGPYGKKNATKGASIRLLGNSLFVKKEYALAYKMYTRGLMFVRDEDGLAPLLYADRSDVYFHLEQYENTLEDIERAFHFGYGNLQPIGKLLIRKGFSLLALGRYAEVKELLYVNMPANENEPDFAQWQHLKNESANVNRQIIKRDIAMTQFQDVSTISTALTTNEVFHPHEQYPWLNAKVDLRYDAEKGYSLVSKEELKYGEIVAINKPFVNLDPKRESYERCHYCMVPCFELPKYFSDNCLHKPKLSPDSLRMATPLACPVCSNVLYCSEACRTAAWTAYHRFECSQMAILSKMDSKAHLALRMLYMNGTTIGSIEMNAPIEPMMAQPAHSLFSNDVDIATTFDKYLERHLTVSFLLKLMQMSDLLIEPKSIDDQVCIAKVSNAFFHLTRHLAQVELSETVPFTDPTTNRTVCPLLSIDQMSTMLKHSCEATVATSPILTESFESSVKLLYATGAIPAGTVLTLAYDIDYFNKTFEEMNSRKDKLKLRYSFDCTCTRCVREERDCLDSSTGVYYPIGCSLCGSLMVRAAGSYRCSSHGCNFKFNARQMKDVYKRVGKMLETERNASFCLHQKYCTLHSHVMQVSKAIASTVSLLYGRSLLVAQLYSWVAYGELLISLVDSSSLCPDALAAGVTHRLYRCNLATDALRHLSKVLDILEGLKQGPGVKTKIATYLAIPFDRLKSAEPIIYQLRLFELIPPIEQVRRRYEALLKMTAYETMVVSTLAAKK